MQRVKMKLATILCLAILFVCVNATVFNFQNFDGGEIWIGTQGNGNVAPIADGGFKLAKAASISIAAPDNWSGRIWSRTWCNDATNHCQTGGCGDKVECDGAGVQPPATIIDITLNGSYGLDYYDINLVDGFNSIVSIEPVNGQGDDSKNSCKKASCPTNINTICPEELKVFNDNDTEVIACKSACNALKTDEYCCQGAYSSADTCKSSDWPIDYASIFKKACPNATSYNYDDQMVIFTCKSSEYNINFGVA